MINFETLSIQDFDRLHDEFMRRLRLGQEALAPNGYFYKLRMRNGDEPCVMRFLRHDMQICTPEAQAVGTELIVGFSGERFQRVSDVISWALLDSVYVVKMGYPYWERINLSNYVYGMSREEEPTPC